MNIPYFSRLFLIVTVLLIGLRSNSDANGADRPRFPFAALADGKDGFYYGTTVQGGSLNDGTIYRVSPSGVVKVLYEFDNGYGSAPYTILRLGNDGFFYGTTSLGSAHGGGSVFKVSKTGTISTVYDFTAKSDGADSYSSPIFGSDGLLYGANTYGGTDNYGVIYKVTTDGTLTTLHSFTGGADGAYSYASLVQGKDGLFYGAAFQGGNKTGTAGAGTVFKVTTDGVYTVLHEFSGSDGANPSGALIEGANGVFYGTASMGGKSNYGTLFKITSGGTFTKLHDFTGKDGKHPAGALIFGRNGHLYGSAQNGGAKNLGLSFEATLQGKVSTLHSFSGIDGIEPNELLLGGDKYFYGTTAAGGLNKVGSIFKVSPSGSFLKLSDF